MGEADPRQERRSVAAEILVAGAAAVFFLVAFLLVPLLGTVALPLAAVPAVRLAHRRGGAAAAVACGAGAALIMGVGAATGGSAIALAALAGGITLLPALFAAAVRRGVPPSRAFLALCAAGLLPIAGFGAVELWSGRSTVEREIGRTFDGMIPAAVASYERSTKDPVEVERVRRTLTAARDLARRYWPGLLGASWVLGAAVAFYSGARAARPAASAEATRFERLRAPAALAGLFVLSGAGTALARGTGRTLAGNVLLPLGALFFAVGLSIICHFARKWFRFRILRIGLYGLLLYFPMNLGVALLGLFDWYADFRRRGEGATEKI